VTAPSSRRRFLKLGSAAAAGGLAVAADAIIYEPNHLALARVEITLRRLPRELDGFTIVQLSDFHYDPYFSVIPIEAAVRMSNELAPDLVVLTGDFVSTPVFENLTTLRRAARQADPCAHLLQSLRAPHGVWAVLGNHDGFSDPHHIQATLRRVGIQVLSNSAIPLARAGRRLWLAGVQDVLTGEADLGQALAGIPVSDPVVLLAHEPDFADVAARYPVDLQLSGHSHGGQVRFPLLGAVYLPRLARKYPKGLRQIDRLTLYTNVGIGTLVVPVRWNCPPEVTLITLRAFEEH
jgi:predicted MPP superfamily phosphohydrolase